MGADFLVDDAICIDEDSCVLWSVVHWLPVKADEVEEGREAGGGSGGGVECNARPEGGIVVAGRDEGVWEGRSAV